jgi:hypothetical protein
LTKGARIGRERGSFLSSIARKQTAQLKKGKRPQYLHRVSFK